jgi:putative MATE family efflux protein
MILLLRGRAGMQLQKQYFKIDLDLCWRILRIGIPGGADQLFLVACHVWFLSVISSLGTLALAAHSLGIRIESLAYLPGSAFHVAAATMTGQYLGAGDYHRARKSALTATLTGGTLMIGTGFLFYFGAEWLTSIFLVDAKQEVATVTIRLLQMVSISMPSLALMIILNGALRGAGDTRWPLLFTFVGLICIRIPLAYWLAKEQVEIPLLAISFDGWGLGIIGAWYAMIVDVVVRSLMITARFWHGGWQNIRV